MDAACQSCVIRCTSNGPECAGFGRRTFGREGSRSAPPPRRDPYCNWKLADLLARSARKDERAFAQLYRLSSPRLFSVASRIIKSRDLAEDVLQESFVNIWHHAADYDGGKSAPMTWMSVIVRNRALDWQRRPSHLDFGDRYDESAGSLPCDPHGPEELAHSAREADRLFECLNKLPYEYRRAITLAYLYGMSHAEISERLRRPLGTVKSGIRRGLQQLRTCLEARQADYGYESAGLRSLRISHALPCAP